LALHYVFDSPHDKLVFDVGHQSYAHKLVTGRKYDFYSLRQKGGISGFPTHKESEYDTFDAGHSSTSISSALGLARARDNMGENYHVVALIGDGAIGGGMAFEALNDAGNMPSTRLIIVLNDNEMSISKNVGALSKNFSKLRSAKGYLLSKKRVKKALDKINHSGKLSAFVAHLRDFFRYLIIGENVFESMNITYLGPINGHSLKDLIEIFSRAKECSGPVLIHTVTCKGRGYDKAEENPEKYHGVSPCKSTDKKCDSFNKVFGETLIKLSENNDKICAVTAGMTYNTGLNEFASLYAERFYDTGIAEQHALAMAGGLAKGGMKPFVVIYSTFLQRGFDQIFHDICLQEVPVTICIDHAGLTGEDGATHQGIYDVGFLRAMPGLIVLEPRDADEFARMLEFSVECPKPVAIRYPKGSVPIITGENNFSDLKWDHIRRGNKGTVVSFGLAINSALKIAEELDLNLVDARVIKPLDETVLKEISSLPIYVIEDNSAHGGLFEAILRFYSENNISIDIKGFYVDDRFVSVGTVEEQYKENCLDADSIIGVIKNEVG
ncbi:MAG: 1-deoxy-D-xylulose-5-phosphate synthase, partial [Clostridia bacterium]|nr:1-deoxy-D-xylulose-5-phosphate synthase [Clostridia bacterium]